MTYFRHVFGGCAIATIAAAPLPSFAQQGVVPQTRPCNPNTSSDCFPILVVTGKGGHKAEIPIDRDEDIWRNVLAGNSTIDPDQMDRSATRIFKAAAAGGETKGIEQGVTCGGGVTQTPGSTGGTGGSATCSYTIKWGKGVGKK